MGVDFVDSIDFIDSVDFVDPIDFNHISENLSEEEVDKLKSLYYSYHRNCVCYKWKYKKLKKGETNP